MKKFLALLLAAVMTLALVACGGKDNGDANNDGKTTEKVAMITDYGDITDQSFNQTTYEACKEFCEANGLQFNYFKPAGDSDAERVARLRLRRRHQGGAGYVSQCQVRGAGRQRV